MHLPIFDSPNEFYTFYYDESNNHRKFYINEEADNYNVDKDHNKKQKAATNFMLGGLAHKGASCAASAADLITSLKLQKTADELKFGQIASGNFDTALKSPQITHILRWILDSDLYVHYFNLSLEYWAFIDIIDDCVHHCVINGKLIFQNEKHWREFLDFHKDVLYRLLEIDKAKFLATAKKFDYPKIDGKEREFLGAIVKLAISRIDILLAVEQSESIAAEIISMRRLAELLQLSEDIDDMGLTYNDEPGVLVDGLTIFYDHRGTMFPNSEHVFDDEFSVEEDLAVLNRARSGGTFKYRFVNSLDSHLTQVSDVIAGLFGKYFEFIERNELDTLLEVKAKFNRFQAETLRLMKAVIEKSDDESKSFLHYTMTASTHYKHAKFMFPDEA
ncbi:hypothetical protein [Cupriavidus sp. CuC1]|uniref:hypothetical protein n=1 Tax=Cupriavidus sp. CuC1 TaxID=3373131 RepID=UPI0037D7D9A5